MNIEGKRIPLLDNPAQTIDIWPMNNGIGITMSDKDGKVYASAWLTKDQWRHIVSYLNQTGGD